MYDTILHATIELVYSWLDKWNEKKHKKIEENIKLKKKLECEVTFVSMNPIC
jgi:hypothetical protein